MKSIELKQLNDATCSETTLILSSIHPQGNQSTLSEVEDIPRRLTEYLESTTRRAWILEDKRVENSFIKITFGHTPDKRLVIDNFSQLVPVPLKIPLTKNQKQPIGLVIGPTGAGKKHL